MTDFVMVRQHPELVSFVDHLQRKNAEALSFYPRQVFEREAERGRIILGLLNGQPIGYLYFGSGTDGTMRCHQVCIDYDERRRMHGAALVCAVEEEAFRANCAYMRLRCGFDLDANSFWRSLGYSCDRTEDGGIRRMRRINVWVKAVGHHLFSPEHSEPERGKTSASIWAKHRTTGLVTQFVRGEKLREYRATVLRQSQERPHDPNRPREDGGD